MKLHPIYERPEKDQGREERTDDWNKSEIIEFLECQYDNSLEEFGVDNYDELEAEIDEIGLAYDEESDWRHEQVSDLGQKNYDWGITTGLARKEDLDDGPGPDDYVPFEVRLLDKSGEVQVDYENK